MQPTTAAAECPGRTCGRGWQPKSQAQPTTTSEAQHRLMQRAAFEQELEKYPKLRSDKFDAFIESWERSVSPPRSPAAAPALAARTAAPQADLDFWKQLREVLVQAAGSNAAKVQAEFEKRHYEWAKTLNLEDMNDWSDCILPAVTDFAGL